MLGCESTRSKRNDTYYQHMKVKCENCSGPHKADSRGCKSKEEVIQRVIQERQIWREKRKKQHSSKDSEKKDETKGASTDEDRENETNQQNPTSSTEKQNTQDTPTTAGGDTEMSGTEVNTQL
jgi:hypothetical protein